MGAVEKVLSVKDGFSKVLNNYIDLLTRSMKAEDDLANSHEQLDEITLLGVNRSMAWEDALQQASYKTLQSVESLETMQEAMKKFVSEAEEIEEVTEAYKDMQNAFTLAGYEWTDVADNFDKNILLMENSLSKLEKAGFVVVRTADEALEASSAVEEFAEAEEYAADSVDELGESVERTSMHMETHSRFLTGLTKKLIAIGMSYLSVRRIISYFRQATSRAPDAIAQKYAKLKENISNLFAGTVVSAMDKMGAGVDKLNAALASPAGQKFARAMEAIGRVVGSIVAVAFEKLAQLIEWMGRHMEPIAMAGGIAFAFLASKMFLTAAATIAAHAPMLMFMALLGLVATVLYKTGVTAEQVFSAIGAGLYILYGIGYNVVADAYNLIATFAEFLINVFNDPAQAIGVLFYQLGTQILDIFFGIADGVLSVIGKITEAIDKITGKNFSASITSMRESLVKAHADKQAALDEFFDGFTQNDITLDRMERLNYSDLVEKGSNAGALFGKSLSDYSLENAIAQDVKAISGNTSAIRNTLSEEDLSSLVDMAERAFVNQVNLTSQTPIITINGANTGNTEADRLNLSNAIRDILLAQVATGPSTASAAYYGNGV